MGNIREDELVAQAQQGNEAAVELLIRLTYEDIYRFVRWKIHDSDVAWDISQMTYEKAWTRLDTYNGNSGSFRAWLLAIARHSCIDYLRSREVRQSGQSASLPENFSEAEDFLDGVLLRDEVRQVYTAMQSLQIHERDALMLRYKQDMTYNEIARITEETEYAVKARIRRALIKLRRMLSGSAKEKEESIAAGGRDRYE